MSERTVWQRAAWLDLWEYVNLTYENDGNISPAALRDLMEEIEQKHVRSLIVGSE